jgi:ribosomal protein S9
MKYDVDVQLTGEDGNAFAIMGAVTRALRQAGATHEEIAKYTTEAMSGDYNNLLRVSMEWVNVE